MRLLFFFVVLVLLAAGAVGLHHARKPLPGGLDFRGPARPLPPGSVRFFADVTARAGEDGPIWSRRVIFDEVIRLIGEADDFVVADFFLVNEFAGGIPEEIAGGESLSSRFAEALVDARRRRPEMPVILVTDPINTVYGAVPQPLFERLRENGVEVVPVALPALRDSNLLYSPFWRMFFSWWGEPEGDLVPNPLGEGRIGLPAFLELLNFKANHRKTLVTGSGGKLTGLVTSANPHSASALHGNVALRFSGPLAADLLRSEEAVYRFTTGRDFPAPVDRFLGPEEDREGGPDGKPSGRILTENAIKRDLLGRIDRLGEGDLAEIALFYFADHRLRGALAEAIGRGALVRLLLDPNKDAFGRKKNGIPNRQTGLWLAERGAEVRWYRTSGEQFHAKMALFRYGDGRAALSLGSANWTRRNLDNLNLETNVVLAGPAEEEVFRRAGDFFSLLWSNAFGRGADGVPADLVTSLPFEEYKDPSRLRKILAWLMERTGAGTF